MLRNIDARIERLEALLMARHKGLLPQVVNDDISEEELAHLRQGAREVLTFSEMVDACVVDREPLRGGAPA